MKALIIISISLITFAATFYLVNGIAMLLIGSLGHWFDITVYKFISFWEVAGIGFIFGLIGYNSK